MHMYMYMCICVYVCVCLYVCMYVCMYGCVLLSTTAEFGGGSGWTLYPPLSTSLMSLSPVSMDVIVLGLALAGISSFLSSLNFLTTIFHIRAKGFALGFRV